MSVAPSPVIPQVITAAISRWFRPAVRWYGNSLLANLAVSVTLLALGLIGAVLRTVPIGWLILIAIGVFGTVLSAAGLARQRGEGGTKTAGVSAVPELKIAVEQEIQQQSHRRFGAWPLSEAERLSIAKTLYLAGLDPTIDFEYQLVEAGGKHSLRFPPLNAYAISGDGDKANLASIQSLHAEFLREIRSWAVWLQIRPGPSFDRS